MENWQKVTTDEISEKIGMGPFGSSIKVETFVEEGIPVISGSHLNKFRLEEGSYNFITEEHADKLRNSNVFRGDIVFTHAGTIGQVSLIPNNSKYERYVISQRQFYLRSNKERALPEYLIYYFRSPLGQSQLLANASSTGVPSITQPVSYLRKLQILLPPIQEQKAIAKILSSLDDKIEINQQMNATLEAMARTLFKAWFVDFEPVRANIEKRFSASASPDIAKLFPTEFENEIPKGWRIGTLSEISFNHRQNVNPNEIEAETAYVGLEHIPRKSIALISWGKSGKAESTKSQFRANDILFGKLRPYFHKVVVAPIDGICSTDILVIRPKDNHHFGQTLISYSSDEIIQYADRLSNGAKMPRTNWSDLAKFEIVIPTTQVSEEFSKIVISFSEKIKANIREIKELEQIRDSILPRLITGKVSVGELPN